MTLVHFFHDPSLIFMYRLGFPENQGLLILCMYLLHRRLLKEIQSDQLSWFLQREGPLSVADNYTPSVGQSFIIIYTVPESIVTPWEEVSCTPFTPAAWQRRAE